MWTVDLISSGLEGAAPERTTLTLAGIGTALTNLAYLGISWHDLAKLERCSFAARQL